MAHNSNKSKARPKKTSASSVSPATTSFIIEKMAIGGAGIGHYAGKVVFVPFTTPGDNVVVEIVEDYERYSIGKIKEFISPSKDRIEPQCPVFTKCGGCDWQHIPYELQLKYKQEIFLSELRRIDLSGAEVLPIQASPKPFNYRNRAQLHVEQNKVGYYGKATHSLVEINGCDLVEKPINEAIRDLINQKLTTQEKRIEIYNPSEEGPYTLRRPAISDFSQVNRRQNDFLVQTVVKWALEGNEDFLYDLYSGAGNFYFPLISAKRWKHATGCEMGTDAARKAQEQLKTQNLSPKYYSYYCGDVWSFVRRHQFPENSLIILDPPRSGCEPKVIDALAHSPVTKILFVSCNPSTLQRDLARLLKLNSNARITKVLPFDMFPQTSHIEALVEVLIDTRAPAASL